MNFYNPNPLVLRVVGLVLISVNCPFEFQRKRGGLFTEGGGIDLSPFSIFTNIIEFLLQRIRYLKFTCVGSKIK